MHLHNYQINLCPAEPRCVPFLETTDQLIRIHSFAFSLRSCQNLAIFAQQYRVKQFKFDSLCRIVVVFCVCLRASWKISCTNILLKDLTPSLQWISPIFFFGLI